MFDNIQEKIYKRKTQRENSFGCLLEKKINIILTLIVFRKNGIVEMESEFKISSEKTH
jgi:hypothetical protein